MANWPGLRSVRSRRASPEQLGNMATGFTYEPGSTFKAFTVAGALEQGLVTPATMFDLPPSIQVADRDDRGVARARLRDLSVADILKYSSNVGAVEIGLEARREGLRPLDPRFGFGEPTGVDFPGEEQGIVIPVDDYSGSTMGNLPIGQGLSVTPMQMAAAYSAIADGGVLHTPRLVALRGRAPGPRSRAASG